MIKNENKLASGLLIIIINSQPNNNWKLIHSFFYLGGNQFPQTPVLFFYEKTDSSGTSKALGALLKKYYGDF
jgi:hypothetical protein